MSRFTITDLPINCLSLIERQRLGDGRGFLSRLFCSEELFMAGWHKPIAQINFTHTSQSGTVRGMHYQNTSHAEMKLVTCLHGEVWDVAVDIREGSTTFLNWHAEILSAENNRALLIPEGFAHGFQALTDDVQLLYCHSSSYSPEAEIALNPKDAQLSIRWPIAITQISDRDARHPMIDFKFKGVKI